MRSRSVRFALLLLVIPVALAGDGRPAVAQVVFPGSTAGGDYLRGVGMAAWGMGLYNLNTAQANAINTQTFIGWNEYLAAVAKNQREEYSARRVENSRRHRENYEMILLRIKESPEERDVENGDSLNALTQQLLDPSISPSSLRGSPVLLGGDVIRRIPFAFGPANMVFSMQRLSAKNNWPVGLRGPELAAQRREYERAFDGALEQIVEGKGKLSRQAIASVETAIEDLRAQLDRVVTPSRDKVYLEAKNYLVRLEAGKELIKLHAIEPMLGEIDKYAGTTVYDLMEFMRKYKLRFAPAEIGPERIMYPQLYAALQQQLGLANSGERPPREEGEPPAGEQPADGPPEKPADGPAEKPAAEPPGKPAVQPPPKPGVLPPEPELPPVEDRPEEPAPEKPQDAPR